MLSIMGASLAYAAQKVVGDTAKGKAIANETCAGCHGADGNSEVPTFPKLAGQQAVYLVKEMQAYKAGQRISEIMQPVMAGLSDDDMTNLAAYYAKQEPTAGGATKPELVALGKKIYFDGNSKNGVPSCDGCHEEDGTGSVKFPRVAGQHADFTVEELKRYSAGQRAYASKVMHTVAQRLTGEEAEAVAQYMASMK
jgi:cytochrome c553